MPVASSSRMISCLKPSTSDDIKMEKSLFDLPDEILYEIMNKMPKGAEVQRCRLISRRFETIYQYNRHRFLRPEISVNLGINWYYEDDISFTIRSMDHKTNPNSSSIVLISRPDCIIVMQGDDVFPQLSLNFYKKLHGWVPNNRFMSFIGKTRKSEVGRCAVRNLEEALTLHFGYLSDRFTVHFNEVNFNMVNRYLPLFVKTFLASKLRVASVRSTISNHSQDVEEFFKAIYKRGCLNYSVVDVSHCNIIERVPLRNFNCVLLESNIPWEVDYFIDTARRWRKGEITVGALLVVHGAWAPMSDHLQEMMDTVDPNLEKDWEGCFITRPQDNQILRFERFRAGGNYDNGRTVLYLYDRKLSLTINRYNLYRQLRGNPKFAFSRGILTR